MKRSLLQGTTALVLAMLAGCGSSDDCETTATCGAGPEPAPSVDASSDASTDAGPNGQAPDSGAPDVLRDATAEAEAAPVCDRTKSPAEDACVLTSDAGVFVAALAGDAGLAADASDAGPGTGTRADPYRSITLAIAAAQKAQKRVYVCADTGTFDEHVAITGPAGDAGAAPDAAAGDAGGAPTLEIYGGVVCAATPGSDSGTPGYDAQARAKIAPVIATGVPALRIAGLRSRVVLHDFDIQAPDETIAGASSIAVFVDHADAVLDHVSIKAGKGAVGVAGADGTAGADGATAGAAQKGEGAYAGMGVTIGGWWSAGPSACGSRGGDGGGGHYSLDGSPGLSGTPVTNVTPANVDNHGATDANGLAGSRGNPGGVGTVGTATGSFWSAGYLPAVAGSPGTDGFTGQGGGGGGGGLCGTSGWIGSAGGAGGMGGCGGKGGSGGKGGGASVALFSWAGTASLTACDLVSAAGGNGGNGGNGGPSGKGKPGGLGGVGPDPSVTTAGSGGDGGDGGLGGPGAGGSGGPSYVVVYAGTPPASDAATTMARGTAGAPGAGGTGKKIDGSTLTAPSGAVGAVGTMLEISLPDGG
jgi:hypothetical protein